MRIDEKKIHKDTVKENFITDIIYTVIDAELEKEEISCQYRRDRIDYNTYEKIKELVFNFKDSGLYKKRSEA